MLPCRARLRGVAPRVLRLAPFCVSARDTGLECIAHGLTGRSLGQHRPVWTARGPERLPRCRPETRNRTRGGGVPCTLYVVRGASRFGGDALYVGSRRRLDDFSKTSRVGHKTEEIVWSLQCNQVLFVRVSQKVAMQQSFM